MKFCNLGDRPPLGKTPNKMQSFVFLQYRFGKPTAQRLTGDRSNAHRCSVGMRTSYSPGPGFAIAENPGEATLPTSRVFCATGGMAVFP